MGSKEGCIVRDFQNNLWQFYIDQDGTFIYRIMYGENKWTKEMRLDSKVEEFCIELDNECNFHIVYATLNGELKYCIYKDKKWAGKTIYSYDKSLFNIKEIDLKLLGNEIHIVFLFCKNGQTKKAKLIHYVWSGEEGTSTNIYNIELLPFTERHFTLEIASESILYLFFLTKDGIEAAVMNCGYINGIWSEPKKLYGITGGSIEIFTLERDNEFSILNVSEDDSSVVLERAFIDYQGEINSETIYETKEKIREANFFIYNKTLWAQWLEGNNTIKYTYFDEKWKIPQAINEELSKINIYRYKTSIKPYDNIKIKVVFGANYPDLKLFMPKYICSKEKVKVQERLTGVEELSVYKEDTYSDIKINKQEDDNYIRMLQKRIATLQMQLQVKERTVDELIEKENKIAEQKRIMEEKNEFFIKLQQETKKQLDTAMLQLKDERYIVTSLRSEVESLNDILQANREKLYGYNSDNEILKKQVDELKIENQLLSDKLSEERNKSIFGRLLKRNDKCEDK